MSLRSSLRVEKRRCTKNLFDIQDKSEAFQVTQSHDGAFATDSFQRFDVEIVANPTRSDDGNAARADALVQSDVGTRHRAVAIDGGDVQSTNAGVDATLQGIVDTQSRRSQPTANLYLIVSHVEGNDQLFAQGPDQRRERKGLRPHCRAHDDSGRAGGERSVRTFDRPDTTRYLQVDAVGDVDAPMDNGRSQFSRTSTLQVDDVDELWRRRDNATHELLDGLAKEDAVVVALFEAHGVLAEKVNGGDDLHSSVVACYHIRMTSGRVVPAENSPETATRFDELVAAFVRLRQPDQVAAFLRDICTSNELDAMGQRLQVARLVDDAVPYQEISRRTGASTATVTRVAHWLRYGEGGYGAVLKRGRK